MRRPELGPGITFLALAVAVLLLIPTISDDWRRSTLAGDQFFTVGPRFFPLVAVIVMGVLSALLAFSKPRDRPVDEPRPPRRSPRAVVGFLVIAAAYLAAFPVWGLLATPFCLGASFFYFGVRRPTTLVLVPIAATVLMYLCFDYAMKIPLP